MPHLALPGSEFVCSLVGWFNPTCVPDLSAYDTLSLLWVLAFVWRLISSLEAAGAEVR